MCTPLLSLGCPSGWLFARALSLLVDRPLTMSASQMGEERVVMARPISYDLVILS